MIGGAPITQQYADEIGADGFTDNAGAAVALARKLVEGVGVRIRRVAQVKVRIRDMQAGWSCPRAVIASERTLIVCTAPKPSIGFRDMLRRPLLLRGGSRHHAAGRLRRRSAARCRGLARGLLDDPRIGWISITDNPGGGPMLPPDWLAGKFAGRGAAGRGPSDLQGPQSQRAGSGRLALCLGRIPQHPGPHRRLSHGRLSRPAEPVFDLDSVGLTALLRAMNDGLAVPGRGGKPRPCPRPISSSAAAVSPFKRHERELMPQYYKLLRKIRAGAQWVIPQLGYDMRKFHEVKLLLASRGMADIPVIGNVYLLTRGVAKLFNSGKLAGCVVSDELLEGARSTPPAPTRGKSSSASWPPSNWPSSAGWASPPATWAESRSWRPSARSSTWPRATRADDWREFIKEIQFSQPDEFFLFEHDPQTGLAARRGSIRSIAARCRSRRNRKKSRSAIGFRVLCIAWPSRAAGGFTA